MTTDNHKRWGALIKDLRVEHGISERQLARLAGVNRSTMRRLEAGTARGDIDVYEKILAVFGYELEAMPTGQEVETPKSVTPEQRSSLAMKRLLALQPY